MAVTTTTILVLACVSFTAALVDAIAGGGGLLTLPALLAAGLPPHTALGTNKGQAVFGAVSSFASFWHRGIIDRGRVPLAFGFGFIGSLAGALLVLAVPPAPLRPIVVGLLVAAAIVVFLRRNVKPVPRALLHPRACLAGIAFGLGTYDGFFGPGVGSMLIIAFALVFGDALIRASANAKVVNLASNAAALGIFAWRGAIEWRIALPMAGASMIGAAIGARIAIRAGDRFVRWVVFGIVLVIAAKLAVDLVRN